MAGAGFSAVGGTPMLRGYKIQIARQPAHGTQIRAFIFDGQRSQRVLGLRRCFGARQTGLRGRSDGRFVLAVGFVDLDHFPSRLAPSRPGSGLGQWRFPRTQHAAAALRALQIPLNRNRSRSGLPALPANAKPKNLTLSTGILSKKAARHAAKNGA